MTMCQIEGLWRGKLAIVPRPRGGDWLEDDVRAWKEQGFNVVVSLLTKDEKEEFDLELEREVSQAHGLEFFEFPIPDLGIPSSLTAAQEFLSKIYDALRAGKQVAIHCRQGIGRSGLVASSLLVLFGLEPDTAFHSVSVARGLSVPETAEQSTWVRALARELVTPLDRR